MRKLFAMLLGISTASGCGLSMGYTSGGPDCMEFNCLWQVEQGAIEPTTSWNERATVFRLAGAPASISRAVDVSEFPDCVEVDITANVARDAQFQVQFDFGDDGSVDTTVDVQPGEWTARQYYVRPPRSSRHLRTRLSKTGPGEVALDYIALEYGKDKCAALAPLTLANDSVCLDDASCTSGYCVLGKCSPCGAGGCTEGSACREDKDCMNAACAAGVCRACALSGSCGKGEGCSSDAQCSARACVFGGQPSLVRYPERDGVCGECDADADCPSGHCVLGQCASCATDADCAAGLRCRYEDVLEANLRSCLPRFDGILPRGSLCEVDAECVGGLRCGGAAGRAKRCGVSCRAATDCAADEVCGELGSIPGNQAGIYELTSAYGQASARVATCYRKWNYELTSLEQTCEVHAQCPVSQYAPEPDSLTPCCSGYCSSGGVDLSTGKCDTGSKDFLFTLFEWSRR